MIARRALGGAVALLAALGIAAASSVPLRVHASPEARLRVAFSARPERVETCRRPSAAELEKLPAHMRQSIVCEGSTARYRLDILRNGAALSSSEVRGGGMRHDRRLFVLRELPVPSGPSVIEVRLTRLDTVPAAARREGRADEDDDHSREAEERRRRMADEVPAALALRESVTLAPREVVLVTYDQVARRLRTVRRD